MKELLQIGVILVLIIGGLRLWGIFNDPRRDKEGYRQAQLDKIEWDKCFRRVNPNNYGAVNHHLVLCYCGTSPIDRFLYGESPYGEKYLYSHPSCKKMGYQKELEEMLSKTSGY